MWFSVICPLMEKDKRLMKAFWWDRHTEGESESEVAQSCPTLCYSMDSSPPGSPVPGILQARTLEWVAISFSNAWKWKVKVKSLSRVWLLATPWTTAYQAPPSMGFSTGVGKASAFSTGRPLPSPVQTLTVGLKRAESERKGGNGFLEANSLVFLGFLESFDLTQ